LTDAAAAATCRASSSVARGSWRDTRADKCRRPFCEGRRKTLGQPFELILGLKGRVDQDQAAPLVRRQPKAGSASQPSKIDHRGLRVAAGSPSIRRLRAAGSTSQAVSVLRPQQARAISGDPG